MKESLQSKKNPRVNNLANLFLSIGLIGVIFSAYLIYQRYNPQKLSFDINYEVEQRSENNSNITPVAIYIESQKIARPIIPAELKDNKWQATTKGVSYLSSSVLPGEKGNSILYGHNWSNLLGNLKNVKPGDNITVNFSDNSSKTFLVEYIASVKPDQTTILNNSDDHRITLYTCSGFLDNMRFVVVAKLLV